MDYARATHLGAKAVRVAIGNIGFGEKEANNDGPLLRAIGGRPGEEWCALFAGYCWRKAYELDEVGIAEWCYRRPPGHKKGPFLEVGAHALVKAMGREGDLFTDPHQAIPGDLVCWRRPGGLLKPWAAHVALVEYVEDGIIHTIEGNVGKFPAKVKRLAHDVTRENLITFATLRK